MEWKTLLCIMSIQKYCLDTYKIYCYSKKSAIKNVHPFTNNYLTKNNIPIHTIPIDAYENELPIVPFILSDDNRDDAEFCIYLESSMLLIKHVTFTEICKSDTLAIVPMHSTMFNSDKAIWEELYGYFNVHMPKPNTQDTNEFQLPYFNTQLIALPESSSFPTAWLDISHTIINDHILAIKHPKLDKISALLAAELSNLTTANINQNWNHGINNKKDFDENTKLIYYKDQKWIYFHKLNITHINPLIQEFLGLNNFTQLKQILCDPSSVKLEEEKLIGRKRNIKKSSSGKPILFLHMGIHRTGTTTIQDILSYNRENLLSQGVLYPKLGDRSSNSSIVGEFTPNKILGRLLQNKISGKELLALLYQEAKNFNAVILSDENYCLIKNNSWLRSLDKVFDIRVIIYLRRQDKWINSWYNQHIRWPWVTKFSSATPDFFVDNQNDFYWIDYEKLLMKIEKVVPRENIHIDVVDPLGIKDTLTDLLEYIGVECIYRKDIPRSNTSISALKLDLLRRIDLMSLKGGNRAKMRILNAIKHLDIKNDDGNTSVLTFEQTEKILKKFKNSNTHVAEKFFGRSDLFSNLDFKINKPSKLSDKDANVYILELLKKVASQ